SRIISRRKISSRIASSCEVIQSRRSRSGVPVGLDRVRRLRMTRCWLRVLCGLAPASAMVGVLAGAGQSQPSKTLDIYVIDVDGGESTLFVSPTGESLLVDAGWPGFEGRDADRIAAVARHANVQQIDYMVVTHFHTDHMGGVPQLAVRLPIRRFIDHGADVEGRESEATAGFKTYAAVRAKGDHVEAKPGSVIPISGFKAEVIAAGGVVLTTPLPGAGDPNRFCADFKLQSVPAGQEEIRAEDARSVSILITFGRFRTVIMGDLGWNLERDLMCPMDKLGPVD